MTAKPAEQKRMVGLTLTAPGRLSRGREEVPAPEKTATKEKTAVGEKSPAEHTPAAEASR